MAIERWELSPSSHPDRYLLKIRGDRADVDQVVRAYARICQEPREMGDPVYQWVVFVVGASLNERLALQDHLRGLVSPPAEDAAAAVSVDLSGVLAELNMVLEGLTGLTEEEQAHVAKKMQQIQQREAEQAAAQSSAPPPSPSVPPPAPPLPAVREAPSPAPDPAPKPPVKPEVPPPAPARQPLPRFAPDTNLPPASTAPAQAPAPEAARPVPATPPPPVEPPPAPTPPAAPPPAAPSARPAPAQAEEPFSEDDIRAAFFYPSGTEPLKEKFVKKLTEVARTKAKKPMSVRAVHSEETAITTKKSAEWIQSAKSARAECFFVLLTPETPSVYMESVISEARQAGLSCHLIAQADIDSRLLYVDLMVELMLIKRKK